MPTRRSTAEAFQILISHAFGDAGSPYLIGVVSIEFEFFFAFNFIIEKYQTFFSMSQISEFLKTYHPYTRTGNSSYIDHSGATASALMSTRVTETYSMCCVHLKTNEFHFWSNQLSICSTVGSRKWYTTVQIATVCVVRYLFCRNNWRGIFLNNFYIHIRW